MYIKRLSICVFSIFQFNCATISASSIEDTELSLVSSYPIENSQGLEPSGLASCNGDLVFISDGIDKNIYKLRQEGDSFVSELKLVLEALPDKDLSMYPTERQKLIQYAQANLENYLDWEGITCKKNKLFLLSETYADILVVKNHNNKEKTIKTKWLESSLFAVGSEAGWFKQHNAYVEGIASNSRKGFVVVAEREPRGIAKMKYKHGKWTVKTFDAETSPIPPVGERPNDFAGLVKYKRSFLSLERNASAVCAREPKKLAVIACWSYRHIESDPLYAYSDDKFGVAEGLAVHNGKLYIVVDNNNDTRVIDANDTRPQIFEFELPKIK